MFEQIEDTFEDLVSFARELGDQAILSEILHLRAIAIAECGIKSVVVNQDTVKRPSELRQNFPKPYLVSQDRVIGTFLK